MFLAPHKVHKMVQLHLVGVSYASGMLVGFSSVRQLIC